MAPAYFDSKPVANGAVAMDCTPNLSQQKARFLYHPTFQLHFHFLYLPVVLADSIALGSFLCFINSAGSNHHNSGLLYLQHANATLWTTDVE